MEAGAITQEEVNTERTAVMQAMRERSQSSIGLALFPAFASRFTDLLGRYVNPQKDLTVVEESIAELFAIFDRRGEE